MTFEELKTKEELMEYMDNNIQYGWIDKFGNKHINELKGLRENYIIISLEDMIKEGLGTCIEQANMIKTFFDRIGKETKVFCHRHYGPNDDESDVKMHCLVFYKGGDKWYHFEHSNQGEKGIHEYDSYEDGINKRKTHFEEKGEFGTFTELKEIPIGYSFSEFNQYLDQIEKEKTL